MAIENTIRSWYKDWQDTFLPIYSVFEDTFGEDKVDLKGPIDIESFVTFISNTSRDMINEASASLRSGAIITDPNISFLKDLDDEYFTDPSDLAIFKEVVLSTVGAYILIYYPEVTITNENDQHHKITDLFVKVSFNGLGRLISSPQLNRSSYTLGEFVSDYMHSHVDEIPKGDFQEFQSPCLGTGPIRDTISELYLGGDKNTWMLFAVQLDRYVHVESLGGIPYHRMSSIGSDDNRLDPATWRTFHFPVRMPSLPPGWSSLPLPLGEFVHSLCVNFRDLGLDIVNQAGIFGWGTNMIDTMQIISNHFIGWINSGIQQGRWNYTVEELLRASILVQCIIKGNSIEAYLLSNSSRTDSDSIEGYQGSYVCSFKGKSYKLRVALPENFSDFPRVPNSMLLLNKSLVEKIINAIIYILNVKYVKSEQNQAHPRYYQI